MSRKITGDEPYYPTDMSLVLDETNLVQGAKNWSGITIREKLIIEYSIHGYSNPKEQAQKTLKTLNNET